MEPEEEHHLATHVRSSTSDSPGLKEKIYCVSSGTSLHLLLPLLLLLQPLLQLATDVVVVSAFWHLALSPFRL